jgi:hypothetical protein
MKSKLALAALSLASIQLGGCATILNGTSQDVEFKTEPAGAVVNILTGQNCTTPCKIEMRRGDDSRVDITMPGFKPVSVYLHSKLGGSTFGNIILGGGIGAAVDGSNGASNTLDLNPVYVRLVAVGSSEEPTLLDKKGKAISTVAEFNAKVEKDVLKGIAERGIVPPPMPTN